MDRSKEIDIPELPDMPGLPDPPSITPEPEQPVVETPLPPEIVAPGWYDDGQMRFSFGMSMVNVGVEGGFALIHPLTVTTLAMYKAPYEASIDQLSLHLLEKEIAPLFLEEGIEIIDPVIGTDDDHGLPVVGFSIEVDGIYMYQTLLLVRVADTAYIMRISSPIAEAIEDLRELILLTLKTSDPYNYDYHPDYSALAPSPDEQRALYLSHFSYDARLETLTDDAFDEVVAPLLAEDGGASPDPFGQAD